MHTHYTHTPTLFLEAVSYSIVAYREPCIQANNHICAVKSVTKTVRIVWDGWWLTAGNGLDV